MAFSALLDLAIIIPIGIPTTIQIIVQTVIIATVAMQSSHMPKYPINKKAIALPTTNFQLREPNQANPQITPIIIIQGVDSNNFSRILKNIIMDQKMLLYCLHTLSKNF